MVVRLSLGGVNPDRSHCCDCSLEALIPGNTVAEDRWRRALDVHEEDPYAHSAERHQQNNDWTAVQLQRDLAINALEKQVDSLQRFKSQALLAGSVALTLLGALAFAVAERLVVHGF